MRKRSDHWPVRLMGCLFGLGALALGLLVVLEPSRGTITEDAGRLDFGAAAIITGLIALFGSLQMPNVRDLWFCNPERSKKIGKEAGEMLKEMIFESRRKR